MRAASSHKSPSIQLSRSLIGRRPTPETKKASKRRPDMVCHYDLIVPFRAGCGTLLLQVAGRSKGQFPHATLHEYLLLILLNFETGIKPFLCRTWKILHVKAFPPFYRPFNTYPSQTSISRIFDTWRAKSTTASFSCSNTLTRDFSRHR